MGEGGGGWTSRVHKVRDSRLNLSQHSPGALSSGPPSLGQGSSPSFSPSPAPQKRWPTPGQSQAHHVQSWCFDVAQMSLPGSPSPPCCDCVCACFFQWRVKSSRELCDLRQVAEPVCALLSYNMGIMNCPSHRVFFFKQKF